jgi:hypothetical protein
MVDVPHAPSFERSYDRGVVAGAEGMVWWSTPAATVGLVVVDGTVVDCPPYAKGWAAGRDVRALWRAGRRQGADLVWIPAPPYRTVEHWWNESWGTMTRRDLWLRTNGWAWQVGWRHGHSEGTLRYPGERDAREQIAALLGEGGPWKQVPA